MSRNVASGSQVAAAVVGAHFRTIGCTRVYRIVRRSMVLGFIPAVVGVSLDGRLKTDARIADIVLVEAA
jgi:hypothetical protein